jgi:hypothetical protein
MLALGALQFCPFVCAVPTGHVGAKGLENHPADVNETAAQGFGPARRAQEHATRRRRYVETAFIRFKLQVEEACAELIVRHHVGPCFLVKLRLAGFRCSGQRS